MANHISNIPGKGGTETPTCQRELLEVIWSCCQWYTKIAVGVSSEGCLEQGWRFPPVSLGDLFRWSAAIVMTQFSLVSHLYLR